MSDLMEFVRSVCADDSGPDFAEPFGTTVEDSWWAVGSNGQALVAIPSDILFPAPNSRIRSYAADLLASDRPRWLDSDVDTLRVWTGAYETPCPTCRGEKVVTRTCDDCDGKGRVGCACDCGHVRHEIECDECDGEGSYTGDCFLCDGEGVVGRRHIDLVGEHAGVLVNLRLLAWMLRAAPSGPVRLGFGEPHAPVVLRGEGWRGLVMPLRGEHRDGWRVEPFPPLAVEAAP